ncbi:MAG: hypothetical protein EBZ58_08400 [Bacteroidetes bacterium]|nr:hypothetical protein [Bacteroidota bacterium]
MDDMNSAVSNMKTMQKNIFLLSLAFVFCLCACKESEIYPSTPSIDYKSLNFYSDTAGGISTVKLTFTFKDGDGDLGLEDKDTLSPFNNFTDANRTVLNKYYYNCYVYPLKSINGVFTNINKAFSSDTLFDAFRVQNLTPDGKHKAIRGDIEVEVDPNLFTSGYITNNDTLKYRIFIYDRALHQSNVVESPAFMWPN